MRYMTIISRNVKIHTTATITPPISPANIVDKVEEGSEVEGVVGIIKGGDASDIVSDGEGMNDIDKDGINVLVITGLSDNKESLVNKLIFIGKSTYLV